MGAIGARRSRTRRAPPAPPTRRSAAAAIQPVRWLIWIALDPHHRKNDHAGRLGIGVDIAAAADRAMPVWKLHNDSHAPLRGLRRGPSTRSADRSILRLRTGMVNGSLTEAALTSDRCAFLAP